MEWTDKAQAIAAIVSVIVSIGSTAFVVWTIRQASDGIHAQNVSHDTSTVLSIWEKIDSHWIRFREADEACKNFEFGQLISYYEMACGLFRDKILKTKAAWPLYEHLHDVLNSMYASPDFVSMIQSLKSQADTFSNMDWLRTQSRKISSSS